MNVLCTGMNVHISHIHIITMVQEKKRIEKEREKRKEKKQAYHVIMHFKQGNLQIKHASKKVKEE